MKYEINVFSNTLYYQIILIQFFKVHSIQVCELKCLQERLGFAFY